jgi:hypothetical protein
MSDYDPTSAAREVNLVVTAFVPRVVRAGLYESAYELERSYRERLALLECDEAYIESALAFGRTLPRASDRRSNR